MKRTLAVLMAVAVAAAATGCAGKGQQVSGEGNKTTAEAEDVYKRQPLLQPAAMRRIKR